jgi:formate hydrogenlyase subunit 3/multisubunit Na+/H+ antiporter MnhD subunit
VRSIWRRLACSRAGPVDGLVIVAFMPVTAGFCIKAAVVCFYFAHADAHAVEPVPVLTQF